MALPHAAPAARRRRLPAVGGAVLPREPRQAGVLRRRPQGDGGGARSRTSGRLFADHVERPGAAGPGALSGAAVRARTRRRVRGRRGTLRQTQAGAPFALDVPVVVQTAGAPARATVRHGRAPRRPSRVSGRGRAARAARRPVVRRVPPARPARDAAVDRPDLRRAEDPGGAAGPGPGRGAGGVPRARRGLAQRQPRSRRSAPTPRSASCRRTARSGSSAAATRCAVAAVRVRRRLHARRPEARRSTARRCRSPATSVVIVRRHPANLEKAVGLIFADGLAALPGLGRKLPHYGKYSYLGFEGDEPVNVLKGQWTAAGLAAARRPAARGRAHGRRWRRCAARRRAQALAELPPVFSQKALLEHVAWLAAPERGGPGPRHEGPGSRRRVRRGAVQGDRAAAGRATAAPTSSPSRRHARPRAARVPLRNVIGVLPGTKAEWAGQSALLTAHYDHLGLGWPDVHKGDEGKLHPGADDNASGVAVLLELARAIAAGEKPQRTLVFVAFAGEEAGLARLAPLRGASAVPAREDDRRDQPRHRRPAVRPQALGARRRAAPPSGSTSSAAPASSPASRAG